MDNEIIASPCIRNCCLNEQDICLGCFRSLVEIMRWGEADSTERLATLEKVKQRKTDVGDSRFW